MGTVRKISILRNPSHAFLPYDAGGGEGPTSVNL